MHGDLIHKRYGNWYKSFYHFLFLVNIQRTDFILNMFYITIHFISVDILTLINYLEKQKHHDSCIKNSTSIPKKSCVTSHNHHFLHCSPHDMQSHRCVSLSTCVEYFCYQYLRRHRLARMKNNLPQPTFPSSAPVAGILWNTTKQIHTSPLHHDKPRKLEPKYKVPSLCLFISFLCFGRESLDNAASSRVTNTLCHFRTYVYIYCEQRGKLMHKKAFPSLLLQPHSSTANGLSVGTKE